MLRSFTKLSIPQTWMASAMPKRHGDHDEQCIDGPCDTHLHVVIQHVAYKINQRDAGDDEKSAGHQRMPRRIGMENGMERSGQCERRYKRGNPCQQR